MALDIVTKKIRKVYKLFGFFYPHYPLEDRRFRKLFFSPLMKRILLVNTLPLVVLVVTLLYLNQFQNSLLETEINVLREQAKIYAGALSQSAIKKIKDDVFFRSLDFYALVPEQRNNQSLSVELARPLLLSLTNPSPRVRARVYAVNGKLVIDSQNERKKIYRSHKDNRLDNSVFSNTEQDTQKKITVFGESNKNKYLNYDGFLEQIYDHLLSWLPYTNARRIEFLEMGADPDSLPYDNQTFKLHELSNNYEAPPYIRRTVDYRLLITVSEPIIHQNQLVGIIELTREAQDIDQALFSVRASILILFLVALAITVLLSWYLSLTIAKPLLSLANSAYRIHKSTGRNRMVPDSLLIRKDVIGDLARAIQDSARELWAKMDAIERFAADVSHELKNPLSSIRSAIELLPRIKDDKHRQQLLFIITDDVKRLDRLITDIANSSRIESEMSRVTPKAVAVAPIFRLLADINAATQKEDDPYIVVDLKNDDTKYPLSVLAIEDRLVQVLRNLIGNASSFSPSKGRIILSAVAVKDNVEIMVSDEGPGIPENKLNNIFERFYTERPQGENFGQHSGLGLSICRQIVVALKGSIRAYNRYDDAGKVIGASFVVSLPRAK